MNLLKTKSIKINAIFNAVYQILSMLVPLITAPYISRVLGPDNNGIYSYYYSIVSYFVLVATFGFADYGTKVIAEVRDDREKRSKTFFSIMLNKLFLGVLTILAFFIFTFVLYSNDLYSLYIFLALSCFIFAAILDPTFYFQGQERFVSISLRNITVRIVTTIFIFVLVKDINDLLIYSLVMGLGQLGATLIMYFSFENDVEYKYYRLRCINTNSTNENWEIAGFKLHRRSIGKYNFYNIAPNMQSAEQDGYVVSASGRWNASYAEWMAFDGDKSTAWSGSGSIPAWIQIKCPNATVSNCVSITTCSSNLSEMPKNFTIEASNDGVQFDILDTQTDVSWTANETKSFTFENSTAYRYYRLSISATNAHNVSLSELAFGVRKYEYKRLLNKYEYLIPQLTGNTSIDGYIASASSEYNNNEGAWRAFDRQSSQWTTVNGVNSNVELKIQMPEAIACNLIKVATSDAYNRLPRTFRIEASNDDINWTVLHQEFDNANLSTNISYYYENPYKQTAFKYYRLYILTNNGDRFISLQEFQLIHHYTISEY